MEIFGFYEMRKKGGNKKRVVYVKGVPILVRSSEVWEHPRAHTLECPSLRRTHSYGNLPYNLKTCKLHLDLNKNLELLRQYFSRFNKGCTNPNISVHNLATSWFCSLVLSFSKKEPAGKGSVYGSLTGHS